MKRAIIVHCWGGKSNYAWYPWVKTKLEGMDYQVAVPDMPDTNEPQLRSWLPRLQKVVGEPDEELVLIGHSLGTVTIMRYLELLPAGFQIRRAVLVAGFTDQLGFEELENFFESPIDFSKVRPKPVEGFVVIQSDDDPFVSKRYGIRLQNELGARLIIKHGAKHMSGAIGNEGACVELPEVLASL